MQSKKEASTASVIPVRDPLIILLPGEARLLIQISFLVIRHNNKQLVVTGYS